MAWAVSACISYSEESLGYCQDTLVKSKYLKQFRNLLKDKPEEAVQKMKDLRDSLCKPSNIRILVVADIEKLPQPVSAWNTFLDKKDTVRSVASRLSLTYTCRC